MYVIIALLILFLIAFGVLFYHFFKYRFVSFIQHERTADMGPFPLEGYTDKYFYYEGEEIVLYLRSECMTATGVITSLSDKTIVYSFTIGTTSQKIADTASAKGCNWEPTLTLAIDERFNTGYYRCRLHSDELPEPFDIYFIVGRHVAAEIVIVAPVSTWTAYNAWGGQSLYQNAFENKTTYYVSAERPNTAFRLNHDIEAEANIYNWFSKEYSDVAIITDIALGSNPRLFDNCKLLVLAYHVEYVSREMYTTIERLLGNGVSLISLGANQCYWIVRWNADHSVMECRKDLTGFDKSFEYGGMWKHHFRLPEHLFGVGYSGTGMHTFAPYEVTNESHWLYEGLGVKNGDLFGLKGVNDKPISGAETDKITRYSGEVETIAHGLNCENESQGTIYDGNRAIWNGSGGGDFVLKHRSKTSAVLSTASIQSGSGLGYDRVFTGIIKNFIKRYLDK